MVQARAASAGAAGESGGDGGADDDSGDESNVQGDGVGQAQGRASRAGLLHEVHRQALDSARERGEPASALLKAPMSAPCSQLGPFDHDRSRRPEHAHLDQQCKKRGKGREREEGLLF